MSYVLAHLGGASLEDGMLHEERGPVPEMCRIICDEIFEMNGMCASLCLAMLRY